MTFTSKRDLTIQVEEIHIEDKTIALCEKNKNIIVWDWAQLWVKLIVRIVKMNSAIVKNHEQIMHLTETSSGFKLVSESACTK